jgi:hypothetical protein
VLSLPLYSQMNSEQLERVAARICELRPEKVHEAILS